MVPDMDRRKWNTLGRKGGALQMLRAPKNKARAQELRGDGEVGEVRREIETLNYKQNLTPKP